MREAELRDENPVLAEFVQKSMETFGPGRRDDDVGSEKTEDPSEGAYDYEYHIRRNRSIIEERNYLPRTSFNY